MIRPIPKNLLIHSAELITEFSPDKWGKPQGCETVQLKNICVEPSAKHVIGGNGEFVQLAATLYFDCRNSTPRDVRFALKDDTVNGKKAVLQKVSFEGRLYAVQTVESLYADRNRVHHYEVGLI